MSLHDQLAAAQREYNSWPRWMRDAARWVSPSRLEAGDAGMTDDDKIAMAHQFAHVAMRDLFEFHRDEMIALIDAAFAAGVREGRERAARCVETERDRVLALQDGCIPEVDQQLRMTAVLLPDIAAAIRAQGGE